MSLRSHWGCLSLLSLHPLHLSICWIMLFGPPQWPLPLVSLLRQLHCSDSLVHEGRKQLQILQVFVPRRHPFHMKGVHHSYPGSYIQTQGLSASVVMSNVTLVFSSTNIWHWTTTHYFKSGAAVVVHTVILCSLPQMHSRHRNYNKAVFSMHKHQTAFVIQ